MSYAYNVKRGKRAMKARARMNQHAREKYGEAYIHMTPLARWGVHLRETLAARDARDAAMAASA